MTHLQQAREYMDRQEATEHDRRVTARAAMEAVLDTFQWAYPERTENRGEIELRDDDVLELVVWCRDNEDPEVEEVKPLSVTLPWDPYMDPREHVRQIIHQYLTHEADEQMWFGDERPFHPHPEYR